MSNIQKEIDIIQRIQNCYLCQECDMDCLCCEHSIGVMEVSSACNAAIAALQEKQRNDDLRKQGRLVELPCAVNDAVYALVSTESGYIIKKMQVKEIQLKHRPFGDSVFMLEEIGRRGCLFKYYETDFGKAVFSTHEEAEAALMEREVQE